jgi:hypothetical protein
MTRVFIHLNFPVILDGQFTIKQINSQVSVTRLPINVFE